MRVLITGGGGQLAADLVRALGDCVAAAPTHTELDITDVAGIERALAELAPDVVINTAAFHRVDRCESELERSFAVNAAACARCGSLLVHVSTDYVFDGKQRRPYCEEDTMAPINVCGASKAAGELAIRATTTHDLIIRATGLYGLAGRTAPHGNSVETMLRLAAAEKPIMVVDSQKLTPTYAADLATSLAQLLERGATGTYHVTVHGRRRYGVTDAKIHRDMRLIHVPGMRSSDAMTSW
jgi:dTDP-4-dehydrorhamnose reductase